MLPGSTSELQMNLGVDVHFPLAVETQLEPTSLASVAQGCGRRGGDPQKD